MFRPFTSAGVRISFLEVASTPFHWLTRAMTLYCSYCLAKAGSASRPVYTAEGRCTRLKLLTISFRGSIFREGSVPWITKATSTVFCWRAVRAMGVATSSPL